MDDLHRRAEAALEAVTSPSARDGLLKVRETIRLRGSDPTLEALAQRLEEQVKGEVPDLLRRAETELEAGNLTEALDFLRQAHELQPDDPEIARRYAQLRRRRRLEERLRQAETDFQSKLATGSAVDALRTLRTGLEALLEPDSGLPEEGNALLQDLLRLSEREERLAFGRPEPWAKAQELLAQLGRLGYRNWAAGRASQMADRWARLARDVALRGVVASATQLGNLLEAYRGAATYMREHPTDEEAIRQEAETREKLINRLNESASKRLGRAREALERGDFQIALGNLEDIEKDFYGPVEREFPGLLDQYDEVERMRAEVERMKGEVERLQALHERVVPLLEEAESAFLEGRLEEAEGKLQTVPDLREAPDLARRVEGLLERIAQARSDRARRALRDALTAAQTGLRLATTLEQFDALLEMLEGLPKQVDMDLLSGEGRESYHRMLEEVREQRETLTAGGEWEAQAERALEEGDYIRAARALREALAVVREGDRRARLEMRLEEMQPLAERQREREEALQRGRALLDEGKYIEARRELLRAQSLEATVDDLLNAARAGALLASARRAWEERGDWEGAQLDLEEAQALVGDNSEAEEIARQIKRFRQRLERQRETQVTRQYALGQARQALAGGDLDAAEEKVQAVLKQAPNHQEALELQEQIGRIRRAQVMLQQAQEAMAAGNYEKAQALVNTILETVLPAYPDAVALGKQIEEGIEANKALLEAENLARNGEFRQARQTVQKAVKLGADPERVREVQALVEELEERWEAETVRPVRDLFRDGKYAEALALCKQALARAASPDFRLRLENLRSDIVNRWVERDLNSLRQRLQEAADEGTFGDIAAQLDRLKALEPSPAPHLAREIETLIRQTHTKRLQRSLDEARKKAEQGAWTAALDILKRIREQADALGLGNIVFQATTLEMEFEEKGDRERRDGLLGEALPLLQKPSGRPDLERARDLIRKVLDIPRFQDDREVKDLLERAEAAIDLFDQTEAALKRSREMMYQRRFREAENALILSEVSPLLQEAYERQHVLVRLLRRAEQEQDRENWEAALTGYREAIGQDPSVERLLEKDLERCRRRLMEDVIDRAQRALEAAPPNPERAREILDQAEANGWITPDFERTVARLRGRIASQERVAEAARLLEQEDGDPARALEALREARNLLPEGQSDAGIRQWEHLAQALLAWRQRNLEEAENELKALEAPVADLPRVQRLRDALAKAREEAAQLKQAQRRVEEALKAARYDDAVKAVLDVRTLYGADGLFQSVKTRLQNNLEAFRQDYRYAEAIAVGDALLHLVPEDEEVRRLVAGLPEERAAKSSEALTEAQGALEAWDLNRAESALERVETIAAPDHGRRLNGLRERFKERRQVVEQVDEWLEDVERHIGRSGWEPAVEKLQEAREKAGTYPPVIEKTKTLQDRLYKLARDHLESKEFARALEVCELALRLGTRDDLTALQRDIITTRDARLTELLRQAQCAMEAWDLETAWDALEQGLAVAPDYKKGAVDRLQKQWKRMDALSAVLQSRMEAGWQALQERDYQAARRAFNEAWDQVATLDEPLPDFGEARAWRDYTVNMERAVQAVEGEKFPQAVSLFKAAEGLLRTGQEERLPSVLGGSNRLREQRRRAVYDAYRLGQAAAHMADLYTRYRQYREQRDRRSARDLLARLVEERKAFPQLHQALVAPPDDFPVEAAPSAVAPEPRKAIPEPTPAAPPPEQPREAIPPTAPPAPSPPPVPQPEAEAAPPPRPPKPKPRPTTETVAEPGPSPHPPSAPAPKPWPEEEAAPPPRPPKPKPRPTPETVAEPGPSPHPPSAPAPRPRPEEEAAPPPRPPKPKPRPAPEAAAGPVPPPEPEEAGQPKPAPPKPEEEETPTSLDWRSLLSGFTVVSYDEEEE